MRKITEQNYYKASKAELLVDNISTVEKILNIHIDRIRNWELWEKLVKDWLAFCETPECYENTIVVDMIKLYLSDI